MPSRVRICGETLSKFLSYGKGRKMEQNKRQITSWHDLFSLYRDLVGPFQKFEKLSSRQRELERKLEQDAEYAQEKIRFDFKGTIQDIFWDTLKWAIPFLIVFWVILNVVQVNGEYLLNDMYGELMYIIHDQLIEEGGTLIDLVYYLGVGIILGPCLIFLFPFMLIRNVISEVQHISQRKKKNEEILKACEKARMEQLPQLEAAKQDTLKRIAPYFNCIPSNYRNSHALAFFSDSFFNWKVKDIQEAVNLYDQYLHQQRMEQSQREIAEAQGRALRENMDAINALSGQMAYMQGQIQ